MLLLKEQVADSTSWHLRHGGEGEGTYNAQHADNITRTRRYGPEEEVHRAAMLSRNASTDLRHCR